MPAGALCAALPVLEGSLHVCSLHREVLLKQHVAALPVKLMLLQEQFVSMVLFFPPPEKALPV